MLIEDAQVHEVPADRVTDQIPDGRGRLHQTVPQSFHLGRAKLRDPDCPVDADGALREANHELRAPEVPRVNDSREDDGGQDIADETPHEHLLLAVSEQGLAHQRASDAQPDVGNGTEHALVGLAQAGVVAIGYPCLGIHANLWLVTALAKKHQHSCGSSRVEIHQAAGENEQDEDVDGVVTSGTSPRLLPIARVTYSQGSPPGHFVQAKLREATAPNRETVEVSGVSPQTPRTSTC
mmetsp:Transcript_56245/g.150263  ORF Transcript_56245/g.150263 Transcript_56245/m.150263 type:complete len:237 (-) Transcript_56245:124-834(-)